MKIIAIWHSDIAHMTAFANFHAVELVALIPEHNGGQGFWAAYRADVLIYAHLIAIPGLMWK